MHIKSCLNIEMYAFNCVSVEKLWADKLLRFQWQTKRDLGLTFVDPGLCQYLHGIVEEGIYKKMKALSK